MLPGAVERLIAELTKLPGIGKRSAERLAFDLVTRGTEKPRALADALHSVIDSIAPCPTCFFYAENGRCAVCQGVGRERSVICVVETAMDAVAFERAGLMKPLYHVLGGRLSPMRGITPRDLKFAELFKRLAGGSVHEIIVATTPTVEGDATSAYLAHELAGRGIRLTRIGRGVASGSSLEHADSETLRQALEGRRVIES